MRLREFRLNKKRYCLCLGAEMSAPCYCSVETSDCCLCVTMGCSESVGSLDDTTCMRRGRASLTSLPFVRFEWQGKVRADLSAQRIRSCAPPDGACGCCCCRAGCASCCSGATRVCTGLHGSLPAAGVWDTSQVHQHPNESQDWRAECGTNHCTSSTLSSSAPTCQLSNFARR